MADTRLPHVTKERARKLFEQGQLNYSLGEYEHAIAAFREAYELSSAPALLFNLAQAYRLKGECRRALELYRHFVRLAPESGQASKAEEESRSLETRCPAPAETVAPSPSASAAKLTAVEAPAGEGTPSRLAPGVNPIVAPTDLPDPGSSERAKAATKLTTTIAATLLISGVTVGVGAGLLYWWNDSRFERWGEEKERLAAGPGAATSLDEWILREDRNNDLLISIRRVDKGAVTLGILSAVCLVGSAGVGIWSMRRAHLSVGPREISLAWHLD